MKNSVFLKFIAIALCAASLAAAALGGFGAVGVEAFDLHNSDPATVAENQAKDYALPTAAYHASKYARESYTDLTDDDLRHIFGQDLDDHWFAHMDALTIQDDSGEAVYSINTPDSDSVGHTFSFTPEYPMVVEKTRTPIPKEEVDIWGTVMADTLNVREYPSADSDLMDQLNFGDRVRISLRTSAGGSTWGKVATGWINLGYVRLEEEPEATETPVADYPEAMIGLVTHDLLDVYDVPSTDGVIVAMLDFNAEVWILESRVLDGVGWGRIDQGWIQLDYVKYAEQEAMEPIAPPATENDMAEATIMPTTPAMLEAPTEETQVDTPLPANLEKLGEPLYYSEESYISGDYRYDFQLAYYQGPELEVTVWLDEDALNPDQQLVNALYTWRDQFIPILLLGLALFAMTFVYLCATAGRKTDGSVRPSGLNRVPLDVYLLGAGCFAVLCGAAMLLVLERGGFDDSFFHTVLGLGALGIALAVVGFCFCFAAQVKVPGHYWWHHSITGWCVDWILRLLGKGLKLLRGIGRGFHALFRVLPVVWQWLAAAVGIPLLGACFFFLCVCSYGFGSFLFFLLFMVCVAAFIAAVCYGAYAYSILMKGVQHMAQGDLNHKVPTKYLYGTFRDFGEQLNSLGGAAKLAAQRQLKSDRMKTELITNVSHDIKTPLTSIINFVDLLKKPHTEAEGEEYLDVLDRQSQRLKKLIDDLMEMSKASTGNLTVDLAQVDAVEAVNQALGEFADKLARAGLTPVFHHPEEPVILRADGRLVWRVLSNLLNNAVKYALPDTRLYIDLKQLQGKAVLAIKNISRDQLNVDAEELMERFVRGDSARNTEGSGLGLNIAKSLVVLQQGQMDLLVDGDLFKVTLVFPLDQ